MPLQPTSLPLFFPVVQMLASFCHCPILAEFRHGLEYMDRKLQLFSDHIRIRPIRQSPARINHQLPPLPTCRFIPIHLRYDIGQL